MTALSVASVLFIALNQSNEVASGSVELVAEGFLFTEGPAWVPGTGLIFSDPRGNAVYKGDGSTFVEPSGGVNGIAVHPNGSLAMCEAGSQRIVLREGAGKPRVVADNYNGNPFNTTNDLVVRSDGTIFFTDPRPLGRKNAAAVPFDGVYSISPEGDIALREKGLRYPNGIALSPDEKILYVAEMNAGRIVAYDLADDGALSNQRPHAEVKGPDGMAVASDGSLWVAGTAGVSVFNADGMLLTVIEVPQMPSNCTFGGEDAKTLFITARKAVYKVQTTVAGK